MNQEGVRLVADLSHAQQALREERERSRRSSARVNALQAAQLEIVAGLRSYLDPSLKKTAH